MENLNFSSTKKVILFDLNNTLIDKELTRQACFKEAANEWVHRWQVEGEEPSNVNQLWELYVAGLNRYNQPEERDHRRELALQDALSTLPLGNSKKAAIYMALRLAHLEEEMAIPFEGIPETLQQLARRYRFGIISNGNKQQVLLKLNVMGIGRYFTPPSIIDSDSLKVRKPHKRIFQTALQQLHITAKQAVMVGDSWRNDIEGALSVGLDAVWANFRHKKKPPRKLAGTAHVITITKPQELLNLFSEQD